MSDSPLATPHPSDPVGPRHAPVADAQGTHRRAARALDIRTVIGAVLGIYGVVLLVMGLVGAGETTGRHADSAVNLWTGIALTVAASAFLLWVRFRPLLVSSRGGAHRFD